MKKEGQAKESPALKERLRAELVRIHFTQLPAMIVAPSLGGLFSTWVLWGAVNNDYLVIGMSAVLSLSTARVFLYRRYFASPSERQDQRRWSHFAVCGALLSGVVWGSAAPFLYPAQIPEYNIYLLVLLALVPVAPIAALAVYLPAFYAYYLPCVTPYIVTLALQDTRAEQLTAVLLVMMSGATINFAREYAKSLTEAQRLQLELSDQKAALEQAARVKTQFLAAASHDLRQPVHAMGLFLESLQQRVADREQQSLLRHMHSAQQGLRGMLDEMLDISRLDAEVVRVHPQDFSLRPLLEKLAREYAPLATQRGLRFRWVLKDAVVHSDPVQLERILRNLLDNALKYTRRGGILLACRRRNDQFLIQVFDTGAGIPARRQKEIFLEFTQIGNPERDAGQGLGLGLAIVDRLARLLGHAIEVRSRPGRGSIFGLWVAAGQSPARVHHSAAATLDAAGLRPKRVLIVDDNAAIRAGIRTLLQQWGCQVTTADSAQTALQRLRDTAILPEAMIVDYRLARGETAPEAIAWLQEQLQTDIPAIIVTGDTDPSRIREAHASGYLLLHKPVAPERLKVCLNSLAEAAV
ncbi:MAG TPA: hybrid sensor histidine kinase/response regulator [Gammaproteobacteria bacterium]|nr:hybrid sensor histidine kinase/response regulator [Gammaproteobacteria bacterium]